VNQGLTAKLLLNNKGPNELVAQPTLFASSGEAFNAPAVTVQGKSFQLIDLQQWIDVAGPQFREGSIEIFHVGEDLVLGAQIYLENQAESLSFDEKLVELGSFKSSQMEGLWWLPSQKGEVEIALANTSAAPLTVNISASVRSPQRSGELSVQLAPRETRLIGVARDIMHREHGAMSRYGGISIRHSGSPGDLLARGFAQDEEVGYSLPIQFSDPASAKSSELQGVGLHLGSAGSDVLTPIVVLRNISTEPTVVTGRLPYTQEDGARNTISLPHVRLSGGESTVLDISRVMREQNRPWFNGIGGLEFKYSTAPGTVLITTISVSDSGNQAFRVPMWDVAAQRSPTGGYPWRIEGNSSTTVYIKNASETSQKYFVQVNYAGGAYLIGMKTLAGGETISYDVRKIRDEQIPDSRGRVIPLNVSSGQVHWSANGDGMMIGRSEQADLVRGISSNYACMNCCEDSPYADTQRVTPGSATVDSETSYLFTAEEQYVDCYGNYSEFTVVTDATWSSSDTNVATVESLNGNVTGAAPGTATITASWHEYVYHYSPATQSCVPHQNNYGKSTTITVTPHIDDIQPALGPIGSSVGISIGGKGFGNSPTVNVAGSGVSTSVQDHTDVSISVTLTISSDAAGGNHGVTVAVNGKQSNSVDFYVQIPTKLRRDDPGNLTDEQGGCGAFRILSYSVLDQQDAVIDTNGALSETITDYQGPEEARLSPNSTTLAHGTFTDRIGYFIPTCPPAFTATCNQGFKVALGGHDYTLSSHNAISMGRTSEGSKFVNLTFTQ
jgi:hypothetical protein